MGSIPAGAGEPRDRLARQHAAGVYPRGCGGASSGTIQSWPIAGLSPRVRGSHLASDEFSGRCGSIPAGAGEPLRDLVDLSGTRVYPRGCGGAAEGLPVIRDELGLSPRVRGSHGRAVEVHSRRGSIPAGAGEPLREGERKDPRSGSIPAGAGEPFASGTTSSSPASHLWVYPRGCGGAISATRKPTGLRGLSPRVRASLADAHPEIDAGGSIPAGAGEPALKKSPASIIRVYPRGCGGAEHPAYSLAWQWGLSPRVRGSQDLRRRDSTP